MSGLSGYWLGTFGIGSLMLRWMKSTSWSGLTLILGVSGGCLYLSIADIFFTVTFKKWCISVIEVFKLEKAEQLNQTKWRGCYCVFSQKMTNGKTMTLYCILVDFIIYYSKQYLNKLNYNIPYIWEKKITHKMMTKYEIRIA